jgi:guanylate kinase
MLIGPAGAGKSTILSGLFKEDYDIRYDVQFLPSKG